MLAFMTCLPTASSTCKRSCASALHVRESAIRESAIKLYHCLEESDDTQDTDFSQAQDDASAEEKAVWENHADYKISM